MKPKVERNVTYIMCDIHLVFKMLILPSNKCAVTYSLKGLIPPAALALHLHDPGFPFFYMHVSSRTWIASNW